MTQADGTRIYLSPKAFCGELYESHPKFRRGDFVGSVWRIEGGYGIFVVNHGKGTRSTVAPNTYTGDQFANAGRINLSASRAVSTFTLK
tara:strand:- start:241 stop:507 length:267 start_codon:yes stop_codon:yes gene_type:complete